jgi:hypothetical protein
LIIAEPKKKKFLVFVIEYDIEVDDRMEVNLTESLDRLRETGGAIVVDVKVVER